MNHIGKVKNAACRGAQEPWNPLHLVKDEKIEIIKQIVEAELLEQEGEPEEQQRLADYFARVVFLHLAGTLGNKRARAYPPGERQATAKELKEAAQALGSVKQVLKNSLVDKALDDWHRQKYWKLRLESHYGTAEDGLPNLPAVNSGYIEFTTGRPHTQLPLPDYSRFKGQHGRRKYIAFMEKQRLKALNSFESLAEYLDSSAPATLLIKQISWHLDRIDTLLAGALGEVTVSHRPNKTDDYWLLTDLIYKGLLWSHENCCTENPSTSRKNVFDRVLRDILRKVLGEFGVTARALILKYLST